MFQGLLKRAERSIDQVVAKYTGRAMVAVPLLIAGGFATAALTVKLVELYGSVTAYGVMAGLFAVIGLVTMAIVNVGSHEAGDAASAGPETVASAEKSEDNTTDAADFLPPELRTLLASAAPAALPPVLRGIGRNLPLIFILAVVAFVISRFSQSAETTSEKADGSPTDTPDVDLAGVAAASATAAAAAA